jgi:hypothetical protein
MKFISQLLVLFFLSISFTGCGKQTDAKIPLVKGPFFNVQNGKLILSLTAQTLNIDYGFSMPIPKLNYSDLTISPALEGGSTIQIGFDFRDVEGLNVQDPERLPDGRDFPFVVGGTLPVLAVNVAEFYETTFYYSEKFFGFFVPINYSADMSFFQRLKIDGKQIGIASIIKPNDEGKMAGLLLMFTLKDIENNPQLKRLLKYSKKHPKILF